MEVTSDFVAGLLFADLHRTDIASKQRLEFLLVVDSPNLSDEWSRLVSYHEAGVAASLDIVFVHRTAWPR